LAAQKSRIMLLSGSTSSDFNGKACSPLTVQWTVDTYNLAKGAAKSVIEAGGTKWYFLTVDQAYGHALSRDTSEQVKLNGGQIVGDSVFPPNTSDFASFLLTASRCRSQRHRYRGFERRYGDCAEAGRRVRVEREGQDRSAPVCADGRVRSRPEDRARRL
jgi:Periplasmic binding protein